jgi:hypothetical protein
MQNPFVTNGTQFFICASLPATYDATGYGALSFTKIRGVRSIGDIGGAYNLVESNAIGGIRHNKRSGNAILTIDLEVVSIDDVGQALLKSTYFSSSSYSYKVLGVDGQLWYFTAGCARRYHNPGNANSVADIKISLEVDSELLEI